MNDRLNKIAVQTGFSLLRDPEAFERFGEVVLERIMELAAEEERKACSRVCGNLLYDYPEQEGKRALALASTEISKRGTK